mmetsp:Transcript_6534/g.12572  ORF Transcript_6534/g.12572 Transcript_6534/m.12572 type:complete len:87 (+) Transcript_6534:46-306(+)
MSMKMYSFWIKACKVLVRHGGRPITNSVKDAIQVTECLSFAVMGETCFHAVLLHLGKDLWPEEGRRDEVGDLITAQVEAGTEAISN